MLKSVLSTVFVNYVTFGINILATFLVVPLLISNESIEYVGYINILLSVKAIMELASGFVISGIVREMMHAPNQKGLLVRAIKFCAVCNAILLPIILGSLYLLTPLRVEALLFVFYVYLLQLCTPFFGYLVAKLEVLRAALLRLVLIIPSVLYVVGVYIAAPSSFVFEKYIIIGLLPYLLYLIIVFLRNGSLFRQATSTGLPNLIEEVSKNKEYFVFSLLSSVAPVVEILILKIKFDFGAIAIFTIVVKLPNAIGIFAQRTVDPISPYFAKNLLLNDRNKTILAQAIIAIFVFLAFLIFHDDFYTLWVGEIVELSFSEILLLAVASVGVFVSKYNATLRFYTRSMAKINTILVVEMLLKLTLVIFLSDILGIYSFFVAYIVTIPIWVFLK